MATAPLSFRQVQLVWGVAIGFAAVCVVFGGFTRKAFDGGLDWRHGALVVLGAWSVSGAISTRRRLLNRAPLKAMGGDPSASKRWTAAQLMSIMAGASIVSWGLVANSVIGSPQWLSDGLYVAGILLLFKFHPSRPSQLVD
jgi:hypothetical protein